MRYYVSSCRNSSDRGGRGTCTADCKNLLEVEALRFLASQSIERMDQFYRLTLSIFSETDSVRFPYDDQLKFSRHAHVFQILNPEN